MLPQSLTNPEKSHDVGTGQETSPLGRYLCEGELVHSPRLPPEGIWARVRNVSANGIALPQGARIEPDAELVIQMKPAEPDMALALVACVAQAIRQPKGDWLVRCRFLSRATEADLFARSGVPEPVRPSHSYALARRVLRACYGGLYSPKRAVFSN
jgi:hypothetical protein